MNKKNEASIRSLAAQHKKKLIEEFCPTFVFAKNEYSFPTTHENFAKNVLIAKKEHYELLCQKAHIAIDTEKSAAEIYSSLTIDQKNTITKDALEQYLLISKYFFDKNGFTLSGFDKEDVKQYIEAENNRKGEEHKRFGVERLLHFSEKDKGYELGSKVDIKGIEPADGKVHAPVDVLYEPVEDGVIITYMLLYPLSGAIPGLELLYNLLPNWLVKLAGDFAVHPGDIEGVKVKVLIDPETGESKMEHLITFAHGVKGSRILPPEKLTHDQNGRPFIYVGKGTHPSYAENFIGPNIFADVVSHGPTLEPTEFIDLTKNELAPDRPIQLWEQIQHWGSPGSPGHKEGIRSNQAFHESNDQKRVRRTNYKPFSESLVGRLFSFLSKTIRSLWEKQPSTCSKSVKLDKSSIVLPKTVDGSTIIETDQPLSHHGTRFFNNDTSQHEKSKIIDELPSKQMK